MRSWVNGAGGLIAPGFALALTATYLPWMPEPNVARWGLVTFAALIACVVLWKAATLDRIDAAALAFLAWCFVSAGWSPDLAASVGAGYRLAAVVVLFLALRRLDTRWVPYAAVAGLVIAFALGRPYIGFGNPEFLAQFALVALPLVMAASIAGIVSVAILVLALLLSHSLLPLTLLLALPFVVRKWWLRAVIVSAGIAAAVAVLLVSTEAQTGIATRLDMLAGAFAAFVDRPFAGWGLGSFVYVFPTYQGTGASLGLIPFSVESSTYANAAHNDILQLAMETGVVGLALGAWLAFEIWSGLRVTSAKWALGIIAILCLTGFPMQSPITALLAVVAASRASPTVWRFLAKPVAVMGALAMAFASLAVPGQIMAQAHFSAANRYYAVDVLPEKAAALAALYHANEAYQYDPSDPRIRLAVFQAAALTYERFPDVGSRAGIEAAWSLARSASPDDTLALLTRLQFLIARKECFENRECDRIAATLVRTASRKQEVRRLMEIYG